MLTFEFSTDATSLTTGTWTQVSALNFSSPNTTSTVGALDGNAAGKRTAKIATFNINVPVGSTFWIRWVDVNSTGNDDGLAVDDFSLTNSLATSSAPASIGGRVTNESGRGLNFVLVTVTGGNLKEPLTVLTDNFGNYVLPGLEVGETYVIQVSSKRHSFSEHSRVYSLLGNIDDANFVGSGW